MIEFKKLRNAYGIKQIKNIDLLNGKSTLIYASNGTMKTSFSDAMMDISCGNAFEDVYTNESGYFELISNNIFYGPENVKCDDILVFSKPNFDDVLKDENFARIALSKEKNNKLQKLINAKKEIQKDLNKIFSTKIMNKSRSSSKDEIEFLNTFNLKSLNEFISSLNEFDNSDSNLFAGLNYSDFINNKINNIIEMPELQKQIDLYKEIIECKKDENIFNSNFTYNSLNSIHNTCIKENFYSAKHKLHIFNKDYDEAETKALLDDQLAKIYKTAEAKQQFDAISSSFEKNEASKKFIKILENKPSLLLFKANFKDVQYYLACLKAHPYLDDIKELSDKIDEIDDQIKNIEREINEETSLWKNMVNIFNSRFDISHFTLQIKMDKVDAINVPTIHQIDKSTGKDLTDLQKGRFSTGEKRAIMVLHLMFEIEVMKRTKENFTVILDDIADSFDYKNKLGILKYIYELIANPNIQIIILTHNFDFFRCIALKMGPKVNKLSVKNVNGNVTFKKASDKALLDIAFVKEWFNDITEKNRDATAIDFISLLPFIRSELTIKESTLDGEKYDNICKYIHYKKDNPVLDIKIKDNEIIKSIIREYEPDFSISQNIADKTYNELLMEAERKLTNSRQIGEMQLKEKMAIAVCLRIESKKFVINKDKRLSDNEDAEFSEQINLLLKLGKLSSSELKYCEIADTIVNQYLHVNSYMYEALIDSSADKMKEALKFFAKANGTI